MHSWQYEIGDVLLIQRKGAEVVARVADYEDSLDNTTPLYCNLRVADGQRWGSARVKVQPSEIIKLLPNWQAEHDAKLEAEQKAHVDEMWSKMTPAQKERVHEQFVSLGFSKPDTRSPLDIMIDKACGIE